MRRWPLRGPPPCDSRPPARRPASTCPGPRCPTRCGRGRPGRWRCRPVRPRPVRRVLAGRDHGAGLARRRHLREGGRGRAQCRVARVPPARGGGVGGAAADVRSSRGCSTSTTTATGWRWPSRRSTAGRRRIRGTGGSWQVAVQALDALHDALTPSPVPDAPSAADRLRPLFGGWAELAALDRPPEGLDTWSARHLDRLAELESGWRDAVAGSTLLHGDVRSDNLLVTGGRRRVRGLAARLCRRAGLRPGRLGAVGGAGGRPRSRRAPGPVGSRVRRRPATSSRCWWPHSPGSWCRTRCGRHRPGSPRCAPSRGTGRGGAGVARAPHRLVTPGAPSPASQ